MKLDCTKTQAIEAKSKLRRVLMITRRQLSAGSSRVSIGERREASLPNPPIRAWVASLCGATHRSQVGSARAHVCTPTHMNVSISTTFDRPSSIAVAAQSLPSPPPLACLLGPQFDSPRRLAAAAVARSLYNTAYDIINTIHDFCFIFTCVFKGALFFF